MISSDQLKKLHEQVTKGILASQDGSRESREKSDPNPQLKVEHKVYLHTQNSLSQQTRRKLDDDKVGLSLIPKLGGPVIHKLRLPADAKIGSESHASLSEPADLETSLLKTFHSITKDEDEFEVEDILERRGQRYLIKWKGYLHSENTWEPVQNLGNCQMILRQFRRTAKSRRRRTAEPSPSIH
jgi:hypothetical protein